MAKNLIITDSLDPITLCTCITAKTDSQHWQHSTNKVHTYTYKRELSAIEPETSG
jgi:hypothetical protein